MLAVVSGKLIRAGKAPVAAIPAAPVGLLTWDEGKQEPVTQEEGLTAAHPASPGGAWGCVCAVSADPGWLRDNSPGEQLQGGEEMVRGGTGVARKEPGIGKGRRAETGHFVKGSGKYWLALRKS